MICKSKTIVSSTKSSLSSSFRIISKIINPNLIIVNSEKSKLFFQSINYETKFLPNGVDIEKFKPVSNELKKDLRKKYGN